MFSDRVMQQYEGSLAEVERDETEFQKHSEVLKDGEERATGRSRGTNDSFRAAVDKCIEGSQTSRGE